MDFALISEEDIFLYPSISEFSFSSVKLCIDIMVTSQKVLIKDEKYLDNINFVC